MFSEIERVYQQGLAERRFWNYYRLRAFVVIVLAIIAVYIFNFQVWWVAIITATLLFLMVGFFFHQDIKMVIGDTQVGKGWRARLQAYNKCDQDLRLEILAEELRRHNIQTLDDLQLAIGYYSDGRPVKAKAGLSDILLSILVVLLTAVTFAYNDQLGSVNQAKLASIIGPTLQLTLLIVVPMILIGLLARRVFFSHAKIDSILVEDLSYIYVHFDDFAEFLQN